MIAGERSPGLGLLMGVGLLFVCSSIAACAQVPQKGRLVLLPVADGDDIRFTQIHSERGQLQDEVNRIVQDDQGFMWFGTSDGLKRYDGYGFRDCRHDQKDPNSISGANVYSLFKDRSGRLWVGSDAFLDMFDPATDKFTHFSGPGTAGIDSLVLDVRQDRKGMYRQRQSLPRPGETNKQRPLPSVNLYALTIGLALSISLIVPAEKFGFRRTSTCPFGRSHR